MRFANVLLALCPFNLIGFLKFEVFNDGLSAFCRLRAHTYIDDQGNTAP